MFREPAESRRVGGATSSNGAVFSMSFQGVLRQSRWFLALWAGFVVMASSALAQNAGGATYRIVILQKQSLQDAQRLKTMLETYNYQPIFLDRQGDQYRVLYGAFPTLALANDRLKKIQQEGVNAQDVIRADQLTPPPTAQPTGGGAYSVFLAEYNDTATAQTMIDRLHADPVGYPAVRVQKIGRFYRVYVGSVTLRDASVLLGQLRQGGYATDGVSQVSIAPADAMATTGPTTQESQGAQNAQNAQNIYDLSGAKSLSPAITQTDLWKSLSLDQKRQVIQESTLAAQISAGGDTVAQNVIDLGKRLENLDKQVRTLVENIKAEKDTQHQLATRMKEVMDQAENYVRAKDYRQAIVSFKEALDLDKDNTLGQQRFIQSRINVIERRLEGENFEGENEAKNTQFKQLQQQIDQWVREGGDDRLMLAIDAWSRVRILDPDKYGSLADRSINELQSKLTSGRQQRETQRQSVDKQMMQLIYGLGGAIGVLVILVSFTWLRTRRQQKELISRLHDITSSATMRPMRELEGTNAPLLEGTGVGEGDVFSPRTPLLKAPHGKESTHEDVVASDPLGGLDIEPSLDEPITPRKDGKDKKEIAAEPAKGGASSISASELEDLFGGGDSTSQPSPITGGVPTAASDDMGFDELFAGAGAAPPAPHAAPAMAEEKPAQGGHDVSEVEDVFGGLFDNVPSVESSAPPAPEPILSASVEPVSSASSAEPISFEDFLSGSTATATATGSGATSPMPDKTEETPDQRDLLAIFDEEPSQDDVEAPKAPTHRMVDESTEIPTVRLDSSDLPSMGVGSGSSSVEASSSISIGDMLGVAGSGSNGAGGFEQDFEADAVGQKPDAWQGDYPFASLTVRSDAPPRGSQQYACFEKNEGIGKALFTRSFPKVEGKVGIEFDMCCNDKNKFLLGIYVEKDGDFQQAIHTKILRSEAQTTPTIHLQGESAPYLLGSWAHIKYVVDLTAGKLDSFIDNTRVGRDVPLEPNPRSLNTISIRDNINTTGVLMLDNIKVYPIA
jgi:hypothetical protein